MLQNRNKNAITNDELKRMLKERGLQTHGPKWQLAKRLLDAL